MTTKHTDGEWIDRGNSCVGTRRQLVASVYPMEDENPEENAANVRLIAAAPDLLEALQNIAEYWNQDQNEAAMADACWHAIHTARTAIAKATGE